MKRKLFDVATVISLVLLAGTIALFVHSGVRYTYVSVGASPAHAHWEFGSVRGRFYCNRVGYPAGYWDQVGWRAGGGPGPGPAVWSWRFGGFDAYHRPPTALGGRDFREFVVPHYFVCLVLLVLPLRGWATRHRRHGPGHCAACGYDLRATPDRCPECGRHAAWEGEASVRSRRAE